MPDITMCSNETCQLRLTCYRFTVPPTGKYQSFAFFTPVKEEDTYTCEMYIDNRKLTVSSPAFRRYEHREDCTLLFDKHPIFVVEQQHQDTRGTVYLVGNKEGYFTLGEKPKLEEQFLVNLLYDLNYQKLEKIRIDVEDSTKTTSLKNL